MKRKKSYLEGAPGAVKVARSVLSGENLEIISKDYLSQSGAKSQGMKQLMAGGGVALIGMVLVR